MKSFRKLDFNYVNHASSVSIPFLCNLRARRKCMRTRRHTPTFLDSYVNNYHFQSLVDTGNLSRVDLVDYSILRKAYSGKNIPKITPIQHPIRTAGYFKLKGVGMCKIDIRFGDYSQVWTTNAYVVKNLGVPAILSAESLARMPLVIDLAKAQAHIGPKKHLIPLRPLRAGRKTEPSVKDVKVRAPVGYFKSEDLKYTEYSRLATDVVIDPQSIAYACISLPEKQNKRETYYYEQGSEALKRRKLVANDCVAFSQRRQLIRDSNGKRKHLPAGLYVPIVNFTNEVRKLKAGEVIGKHSILQRVSKRTGKTTGRLRGVDLHAVQEPIKLLPIPDLRSLKGKSVQAIKKALDDYAGPIQSKSPQELKKMRETIDELSQNSIKDSTLSAEQKELLYHVLLRFYDYFSKHKYDVGLTDLIEFEVETGDAPPYKAKTRPMNPRVLKIFQQHLKAMLDAGIWAPGFGAWASALHQVLKVESGDLRFVVDLREVNKVTKTDSYPIAHQQMAIASEEFRKAESFINLDLTGAYLAVPVEKESQDKLAVTTCEGLFKCLRMPFGAKNACGCYARLMRITFHDMMIRKESLSFFDDHLIPCPNFLTGLFRLAKFMFAISKANLRVSLKKSHFFVKKVKWLGFEATAGELLPSDRHVAKVRDWPTPKNSAEIQSFYGLASYHRRFVKDFAKIARPLKQVENNERQTGRFEWTKEAQASFDYLKEKLISKPVLAHPDFSLPFILNTDASLYAMGAELSQVQDGKEKVVAYASRLFTKSEANYSVTRKELLAIVTFVEEFKYYLDKNPFVIRTDHSALTWFRDSRNLTGQLWRWWEILHPFQYTIEHRAGRKHGNADALSRYPYPQEEIDKLLPKFTEQDKIMYEKCGMKPPTRGSLGRKLNESLNKNYRYSSIKKENHNSIKSRRLDQSKAKGDKWIQPEQSSPRARKEKIKRGRSLEKINGKRCTEVCQDEKSSNSNRRRVSFANSSKAQSLEKGDKTKTLPTVNNLAREEQYYSLGCWKSQEGKEEINDISFGPSGHNSTSQSNFCTQNSQTSNSLTAEDSGETEDNTGSDYGALWDSEGPTLVDGQDISVHEAEEPTITTNGVDPSECQCDENHIQSNDSSSSGSGQRAERREGAVLTEQPFESYNMSLEQTKDPIIREVKTWVEKGQRPKWDECESQPEKEYYKKFGQLKILDEKLYLVEGAYKRLCVPQHMTIKIIDLLHQHPLAGHIGQFRTYMQARKLFYWPSITDQIERAISSCDICIRAKKRKPEKRVPLGQTSTAIRRRFSVFYADLVGPWIKKPLPGKYQYLLTLMDGFTKYPEAIPIPKADTNTVLKALSTHIIPRYGVGFKLVTDRGSQFTSAVFKEACNKLGLLTVTTQAYEPHSNPVERMHRTLESAIRCLMLQNGSAKPSNWSDYVPAALASLRHSPLSNLPYSPHLLAYGEEPVVPAQVSTGHVESQLQSTDPMEGIERLRKAMVDIRAKQLHNHERNKVYYDKKVREQPLKVGDKVYLWSNQDDTPLGNLRKTSTYYKGPYEVLEIRNERQVRIQKGSNDIVVSRDRLALLPHPQISTALKLSRQGLKSSDAELLSPFSVRRVPELQENTASSSQRNRGSGGSSLLSSPPEDHRGSDRQVRSRIQISSEPGSSVCPEATDSRNSSHKSERMGNRLHTSRRRQPRGDTESLQSGRFNTRGTTTAESGRHNRVPPGPDAESHSAGGHRVQSSPGNQGSQTASSGYARIYEERSGLCSEGDLSTSSDQLSSSEQSISSDSRGKSSAKSSKRRCGPGAGGSTGDGQSTDLTSPWSSTGSESTVGDASSIVDGVAVRGELTGEHDTDKYVLVLNDSEHYLLNHTQFSSKLLAYVKANIPEFTQQITAFHKLLQSCAKSSELWPLCVIVSNLQLAKYFVRTAKVMQLPYYVHKLQLPWTKLTLEIFKDLSESSLQKGRHIDPNIRKFSKKVQREMSIAIESNLEFATFVVDTSIETIKKLLQKSSIRL